MSAAVGVAVYAASLAKWPARGQIGAVALALLAAACCYIARRWAESILPLPSEDLDKDAEPEDQTAGGTSWHTVELPDRRRP